MKFSAETQILFLGVLPILVPFFAVIFSRAIILKLAISLSALSLAYIFYLSNTTSGWTTLLHTGGILTARWAWPVLEFPTSFSTPPLGPLLLIKTFFAALIVGFRKQNRSWWWASIDGTLCLVVSASDLATYLAFWSLAGALALFWIARQMDSLSDENSETLLRFSAVLSLGFGILGFALVVLASAQSGFGKEIGAGFGEVRGQTSTWARAALWVACLILSAGAVFQASQSSHLAVKRNTLAIFFAVFAIPCSILLMRFNVHLEAVPYLLEVLAGGVFLGGLYSFRSQTIEGMLAGTFICSQCALFISLAVGGATGNDLLLAHFGPFAILLALLAPLPAFLIPQKKFWMGCLRGRLRQTLAGFALLSLGLQLGVLPFGYLNFPFQKLLEQSTIISLTVCLGLLAAASGTLSVLGGFWFADSSARWPTREYTELARRYFKCLNP